MANKVFIVVNRFCALKWNIKTRQLSGVISKCVNGSVKYITVYLFRSILITLLFTLLKIILEFFWRISSDWYKWHDRSKVSGVLGWIVTWPVMPVNQNVWSVPLPKDVIEHFIIPFISYFLKKGNSKNSPRTFPCIALHTVPTFKHFVLLIYHMSRSNCIERLSNCIYIIYLWMKCCQCVIVDFSDNLNGKTKFWVITSHHNCLSL